jgi:hypothetical protein
MDTPISVPAEALDMLPREMWGVYWELFPDGRQELPAIVPYPLWKAQMAKMGVHPVPPSPPILQGYWGKVRHEDESRYEQERKKQRLPEKASGLFHGPSPPVPARFWERYFELFPMGHCSVGAYEPSDGKPAFLSYKPRYTFRNGSLCVRVDDLMPIYVPSTGCDELDANGVRVGPG